jgi:hypothetical protein
VPSSREQPTSRIRGAAARGVAATRDADPDVHGEAVALTVFSTVKWWGRLELPLYFAYIRLRTRALRNLRRLSFIQSARWSLVSRIPYNGPPQPRRRLRHPHLYFESNFNGGWEEYIDAFSYVLGTGMRFVWGSSYGFPGPLPSGPFKDYIRDNAMPASHYYSAYPDATATTVLAALEVTPRLAELRLHAPAMSPEEFAAAWQQFLTESQLCL